MRSLATVVALLASALVARPIAAEEADLARFFAGKTITIYIGTAPGGVLDVPTRLFGRFFGKHVPGRPNVVATNMPGAGSNILARFIYNNPSRDGTAIGLPFASVLIEPLLSDMENRGYEPGKFNFLGSAQSFTPFCISRRDAPVQTPEDLLSRQLTIGVSAGGAMNFDFPLVANVILGTKFRMVKGYKGGIDLMLAVERGEVEATCLAWSIVKYKYPTLLRGDLPLKAFLHGDMDGNAELDKASVPGVASLVKGEADRRALSFFLSQNIYTAPMLAPPGVPAETVTALRGAFEATLSDPEFLVEAARIGFDISHTTGEQVRDHVARAYATPRDIIDRVRAALGR